MPFEQIPYTNFHGTNQDWMIQQIKQMIADWATYRENLDAAWAAYQDNINNWRQALDAAFTQLHTYVHDYFDNLDVQEEINNKLDQMVEDGTLDDILLPYFNAYKNEINTIVNTQNQQIATQNDNITVLQSEMTAFLRDHPATTGEKDAELVNIRVGYNGVIYQTAGEAVRDQVKKLYNSIFDTESEFSNSALWQIGDVAKTTGYNSPASTRIRLIQIINNITCDFITIPEGYKLAVYGFETSTGGYLGVWDPAAYNFQTTTTTFSTGVFNLNACRNAGANYFRLMLAKNDNTDFEDTSIANQLMYSTYSDNLDDLSDIVNKNTNHINDIVSNTDETFTATSANLNRFEVNLYNGRKYEFTNLTTDTVSLILEKTDGTTKTIFSSIQSNQKVLFTCDSDDYIAIRCFFNAVGSVKLASTDNGVFTQPEENKKQIETITSKTIEVFTGTIANFTHVFPATLYNGRSYTFTNLTSQSVNLSLVKSDGTIKSIFSTVQSGQSGSFTCDSDDYVAIRCYFNAIGDVQLESEDSGIFSKQEESNFDYSLTSVSLFETLGAVGDSFTSGGIKPNQSSTGITDHYSISWPKILGRKCGIDATNYSHTGASIAAFLTNTSETWAIDKLEADTPKNLYVIVMGINSEPLMSGQGSAPVGTVEDINDQDYTQNADTFCGHYGQMVQRILNHAPMAKIILVVPIMVQGTDKETAIYAIAEHYNLPCFRMIDDDFYTTSFYNDNRQIGHPIGITYAGMANAFERQIVKCIVDNVDYFNNYLVNP